MSTTISSQRLWVVAHRGGGTLRPENTMAAFWHAIHLGVDMIETDVWWTKDRQLVLCHDASLETTTNGRGNIRECNFSEVRQLDVGSHFDPKYSMETIPTLEDLFRLARGRVKILLDLRAGEPYEQHIIELIDAYRMELDVMIAARTSEVLRRVKECNPAIRVLSIGLTVEKAYEIFEGGAAMIRLWGDWVTPQRVGQIRQMGKPVWVSRLTAETEAAVLDELHRYLAMGINGVILDDPRPALEVNREDNRDP